jgi:hypothetical protein
MCSGVLGCAEDFSERCRFRVEHFKKIPNARHRLKSRLFSRLSPFQYSDHLLDFKFWTRTLEDSEKSFKAWRYDTCRGKFWVHYSIPSAKYILQVAFNFGIAKKNCFLLTQHAVKNQKTIEISEKNSIIFPSPLVTYPDVFTWCKKHERNILTLGHL